jgi:acyl-CoA thioesterase
MHDPFMAILGMEAEVPAPGQAKVRCTVRPEHLNSLDMTHGGFLYTLADAAFAYASNSHGIPAVALDTHMEYLKAGRVGDALEATATEVHLGKRTGVYRIEIRNADSLLAIFTGTVFRLQPKPEEKNAA